MSLDQNYPFPQVFLVNGGGSGQSSDQPPALVPCWPFPPAQQRLRGREKSRGCMGISPGLAMIVLMLFLLVFAALGFEAYQIYKMQTQLKQMRQDNPETEFSSPQKQIGFSEPEVHGDDSREEDSRSAAHVIGRVDKVKGQSQTLRWELRTSRSFVSGGVTYRFEDGGLQVNESGLYHIYSRVELILKSCSPSSFTHSVFVRRVGHVQPVNLMEAHRAGFCSRELQHSWTTDSYLASALKLQKYDRVYVNVSQPHYLTHEHYANFFGLYKV